MSQMFPSHKSLMSRPSILEAYRAGEIVIEPFDEQNVGTNQYDVTLGPHFYRAAPPADLQIEMQQVADHMIYNPFSQQIVETVWFQGKATHHATIAEKLGWKQLLDNIGPDERIIMIRPGETILAHTNEFIGGTSPSITTMMKARSSTGRNFIEVCKCLPAYTEIRLADGTTKTIADLQVGETVVNVDRKGRARPAVVKHKERSSKTMFRARTKRGRVLEASGDHHLRVSRSDGVHLIHMKDLRVGDEIPVLRRWSPVETSAMDEQEATMLGYFVAEGNVAQGRISFAKSTTKRDQRDEIERTFRAVFPEAPEPKRYDSQIVYCSADLERKFRARYPEAAQKAESKRVPRGVYSARSNAVRAFLRAYLRCDAHKRSDKRELQTVSRSRRLIEDIAFLATRFGAVPTLSSRQTGAANNMMHYGYYYGSDVDALLGGEGGQCPHTAFIPDLLNSLRTRYGETQKTLGSRPSERKRVRVDQLSSLKYEELSPYVSDIAWETVTEIEEDRLFVEAVDITLDVEAEEDSLFASASGVLQANCAGMGDIGYCNRWTMEITNNSLDYALPLVVGRRIAQLVFFRTDALAANDKDYTASGKYQTGSDIAKLKESWQPKDMLPKQWRDREVRALQRKEG